MYWSTASPTSSWCSIPSSVSDTQIVKKMYDELASSPESDVPAQSEVAQPFFFKNARMDPVPSCPMRPDMYLGMRGVEDAPYHDECRNYKDRRG
jgi:hypothetical protein